MVENFILPFTREYLHNNKNNVMGFTLLPPHPCQVTAQHFLGVRGEEKNSSFKVNIALKYINSTDTS